MKITEIKIVLMENRNNLRAYASVVLDDCLMIRGIKVLEGDDDFFISMPSRKDRNGKYKDIVFPLNADTHGYFAKEILLAYEEALDVPNEKEDVPFM